MSSQGNRKIKVGVVGCGVVATAYYLPYLMRHADIVAVCDIDAARTEACRRLYGAKQAYADYDEMIRRADIEAVFILTGPGTHAEFTLTAVEAGKHVLLQKPMALTMEDADAIVDAVRRTGVKALIEPSNDPAYDEVRQLIERGALGDPYWFSLVETGPDHYHASLGGNPYGLEAFFSEDSGGMLFDYPYAPTQICSLLGSCKNVMGMAKISAPDRSIVPEARYNEFLAEASDPDDANYWDVVLDLPKTENIRMDAPDNVFSLYEMDNGAIGVFHVGRPFHPVLPSATGSSLQIFGTGGNALFSQDGKLASIISEREDLLPDTDSRGWYHVPVSGDLSKAVWPKPVPGGFNYYHYSSQNFIDCILEDREPIVNVEWGRHITEMMVAAIESSRTGKRYDMKTTLTGLREPAEPT